jgi:energy-coupling factor transporter ATP-binding protein EcfA2
MSSHPNPLELGEWLTEKVQDTPDRALPGSRLGLLARARGFTGTLTELLNSSAPRLTVVGRAGRDLLWGLDHPEDAPDYDVLDAQPGALQLKGEDFDKFGRPERAEFRNFRSLRDVTLNLDDLTVLVGANGAGKSNLLDGLFRLSLLTRRKPDIVFKGRHAGERVVGRWAPQDGFSLALFGPDDRWWFRYERADPIEPPAQNPFSACAGGREQDFASLLFTPLASAFGDALYLHLSATQLARDSGSRELEPFLRHDGLFLPSVLAHIASTDRDRLDHIIHAVAEIVPAVKDVRMPRVLLPKNERGNSLEVHMRGTGWTPADQLSEGTLLAFGLHTVLSRAQPPRMILLDDIDRGLHPRAQATLIDQLKRIACPTTRIICTTHSPYILNNIPSAAVRIVMADPETGETLVHALDHHPDWPEWQDDMTAAEFWQYAGDESWPAPRSDED